MTYARDRVLGALVTERGDELRRRAKLSEELRVQGRMCWRCPRPLAAGARCPDHGRARPWGEGAGARIRLFTVRRGRSQRDAAIKAQS